METVKAQEFYEAEDEQHELGDPRDIEVTPEELEELQVGSPVWIERLNGTYGLIQED